MTIRAVATAFLMLLTLGSLGVMRPVFATPKPPSGSDLPQAIAKGIEVRGFDQVEAFAPVDLGQFRSFIVRPAKLEFDKRWLRDHRFRLSKADRERIETTYAKSLTEALEQTLSERAGLVLATEVGAETLVVTPILKRFRLNAPEPATGARVKQFVDHVGRAELDLRLADGGSDRLVLRLQTSDNTPEYMGLSDFKQTNRLVNLRDFKRLFNRWADRLSDYIVEQ